MALADFPVTSGPLLTPALRAFADWLAARRRARARKIALNELTDMPEHRLRDLGIEPRQIVGVVDERYWPTRK